MDATGKPEPSHSTDPPSQLLYDRSRNSAFDLLKLLISLSTGGVALYFATLTGKEPIQLNNPERNALCAALGFMVSAVFVGIVAWAFDSRFYERWAQHAQGKDPERMWRQRESAGTVRRVCLWLLAIFFLCGIVASTYYMLLRAKLLLP